MDSFEINKILGALLGTLLFVMGIGFLAEAIYKPIEGRTGGYALPEPSADGSVQTAKAAPKEEPLPVLLASADAKKGAKVAKKCAACHDLSEASANKTGPGLWGVVGREIAHHPEFNYSDALKKLQAEDGKWTYAELFHFVESPKTYAPGIKMTFAGLKSAKERADLLAYLQTLSSAPVPFPVEAAPPATADNGADAAAPAADAGAAPAADQTMSDGSDSAGGDSSGAMTTDAAPSSDTMPSTDAAPASDAMPSTDTVPATTDTNG